VAKEVFERQIMDLSWCASLSCDSIPSLMFFRSWDGMTLYAASSDGTIAVFHFEPDEMDGIAPHSVQEQYLAKFNFTPPELPDGYSHIATTKTTQVQSTPNPFENQVNGNGGEQVNILVAKKNVKKKRVNLTTMTSVPSAGAASSSASTKRTSFMTGPGQDTIVSRSGSPSTSKNQQQSSFFPMPDEQPFGDVDMVPIDSFNSGKGKGRILEEDTKVTYRTLGGDRPRQTVPIRELPTSGVTIQAGYSNGINLAVPALMTKVTAQVEGTNDGVLEAINAEEGEYFHLGRR